MQVITKAKLRYLRISPRKVRLLIDLVRGLSVEEAKIQLLHSKKNAARPVLKLINSAVANAIHNDNAKEETLIIKEAYVDGGPVLKRWRPRAFGKASAIKKRTSHVNIFLSGEVKEIEKKEEKVVKKDSKDDKVENKETKKDKKLETKPEKKVIKK